MNQQKKVPIERLNKFFSQDDFDLEIDFGREWLEGDINIKVILYQVDRVESTIDDIYSEAGKGEIRFKPPVEVPVNFNYATPTNKNYNSYMNYLPNFSKFINFELYQKDTVIDIKTDSCASEMV